MFGEAVAHGADVLVATSTEMAMPVYLFVIIMMIVVALYSAFFIILKFFFGRRMKALLQQRRNSVVLDALGMFGYLLLLAFMPLPLLVGGYWGSPFPFVEASYISGWPIFNLANIFLNFLCWFPVLMALQVAAHFRSRVAGWSIAGGSAAAVLTSCLPPEVDTGLGALMPTLWTWREIGFPLDYQVLDLTGLAVASGHPLMFLADAVILSLLVTPGGLAVEHMLTRGKKLATVASPNG